MSEINILEEHIVVLYITVELTTALRQGSEINRTGLGDYAMNDFVGKVE